MFLNNLLFLKWFKDKGQGSVRHSETEDTFSWVRGGQEGFCLRVGISHPCCTHLAGLLTIVSNDMLCWLPCKMTFFYVPFTVQALLRVSGILPHCSFQEHRENCWHVSGTRKLNSPQWLKMGLDPYWKHMNCKSESQTYHLPYLSLRKKPRVVLVFCTVFSLGQCTSHVVLFLYYKTMEWSL